MTEHLQVKCDSKNIFKSNKTILPMHDSFSHFLTVSPPKTAGDTAKIINTEKL